MIRYVWEAACQASRLRDVIVATDDPRIAETVKGFGGRVLMTCEHPSGTDRVAEACRGSQAPIVVNLQGDEPLLEPRSIDRLVEGLAGRPDLDLATLAVRMESPREFLDENIVKVVCDAEGRALYFSRQPLRSTRSGGFLKHIGIYAYRREALARFCSLPSSTLEETERLEQLRALENGMRIGIVTVDHDTIAVDTPADIARVEDALRTRARSQR